MSYTIVADENIPSALDLFSLFGNVTLVSGRELTNAQLKNADILLVRSVTTVNQTLLERTPVKFVGSCTIGMDHIDTEYLDSSEIAYANAPGCNAVAVVQYVVSALARTGRLNEENSVVIVGGGNVGSRVYDTLTALGMSCQVVDPFLTEDYGRSLTSLDAIYSADVVCLHTPLTKDGLHPTYHMLGAKEISQFKPGALLLNAGRGGVIDNSALLSQLKQNKHIDVVLDVWENEPNILKELIMYVNIVSPHIAGYSFEGRLRGSIMVFDALVNFLLAERGLSLLEKGKLLQQKSTLEEGVIGRPMTFSCDSLEEAVLSVYDVMGDDESLRFSAHTLPESFDMLRKNYPVRREFSHYRCSGDVSPNYLSALGFTKSGLACVK